MKVQTEAWEKLKKARENAEKDVVDEEVSFFFFAETKVPCPASLSACVSCVLKEGMCIACP